MNCLEEHKLGLPFQDRRRQCEVSAVGGGFCTHVGGWTRCACRLFGGLELEVSQLELSKRGSLKSGIFGILPEERHQNLSLEVRKTRGRAHTKGKFLGEKTQF
ncbi:hypothetical protein ILYODFUR_019040 [Ilyodon furcidens]|uniref:Uncharacterized protein n=1 Tax=Ilyodon furcidens TaxID=33524 RepID=A0ABV0UW58_9TELE